MLGPSHALSGAAVWLGGSLVAQEYFHYHQSAVQLAIGTAMCAGGALVPDLDMSGRVTTDQGGATVAHTFGVVSLFLAEVIEKISLGIYDITRTRRDSHRHNGHRTFTHTLIFAGLVGWGVWEACDHLGKWAVLVTLVLTFAFALRGLFSKWAKRAGWIITTGAAAAMTWWANDHLPKEHGYPLLGIAVGVGCVVHLLGDMITSHGCPTFWPLPIRRETWHCIGIPNGIAVKVGGVGEHVLRVVFLIVSIGAALALSGHWATEQFHRLTG